MSLHLYIACHCLAVARKHYDAADASSTPNHYTNTIAHACMPLRKKTTAPKDATQRYMRCDGPPQPPTTGSVARRK